MDIQVSWRLFRSYRSHEASHEGPSLLADRLASNAAASSRSGAPAQTQGAFSKAHGGHHSRRHFTSHTAKQHMPTTPASHATSRLPRQNTTGGQHHPSQVTQGSQSQATSHHMPQLHRAMYTAAAAISLPARRVRTLHHMRLSQTHSSAWYSWRQHSRLSSHSRLHARPWHAYAVATYTPKLPGWVRRRLPEMPEGKHSATPAHARAALICMACLFRDDSLLSLYSCGRLMAFSSAGTHLMTL